MSRVRGRCGCVAIVTVTDDVRAVLQSTMATRRTASTAAPSSVLPPARCLLVTLTPVWAPLPLSKAVVVVVATSSCVVVAPQLSCCPIAVLLLRRPRRMIVP